MKEFDALKEKRFIEKLRKGGVDSNVMYTTSKKLLIILLILFTFSFAGCSSDNDLTVEELTEKGIKKLINSEPDNASYYDKLGDIYNNSETYEDALESFKQAVRLEPGKASYYDKLGTQYMILNMDKESLEARKQAIKLDPDNITYHYNLQTQYEIMGMVKEVAESSRAIIRIAPDQSAAHYFLGNAYKRMGMYKEAVAPYKQSIRIDPDFMQTHYDLAWIYVELGMHKEGIESYKQVIRLNPEYTNAHYSLGINYIFLQDRDSALEEHKILKDLDPELANKLLNMINEIRPVSIEDTLNSFDLGGYAYNEKLGNKAIELVKNTVTYSNDFGRKYTTQELIEQVLQADSSSFPKGWGAIDVSDSTYAVVFSYKYKDNNREVWLYHVLLKDNIVKQIHHKKAEQLTAYYNNISSTTTYPEEVYVVKHFKLTGLLLGKKENEKWYNKKLKELSNKEEEDTMGASTNKD